MNILNNKLFSRIKETVMAVEPTADVILYGSYARGENKEGSDIDLIVLVNKPSLSYFDKKKISYPLYALESEIGIIISPLIFNKSNWENEHNETSFYNNVNRDAVLL
jgi:uncharacterized protein